MPFTMWTGTVLINNTEVKKVIEKCKTKVHALSFYYNFKLAKSRIIYSIFILSVLPFCSSLICKLFWFYSYIRDIKIMDLNVVLYLYILLSNYIVK